MRCFLAIGLPSGIRERIFSAVSEAKDTNVRASFAKKEQLHVTLLFLGEKSDEEVRKIAERLRSLHFKKFTISLEGFGFFPSEKYARVFWMGATDVKENTKSDELGKGESGELKKLHFQVANLLSEKPERDFKGHITLARIKSPENIEKLIALKNKLSSVSFGSFEVSEIVLKKSVLTSNGAIYEDVERLPLVA